MGTQTFAMNTTKKGDGVEADVKATYCFNPYTLEVTAAQSGKVSKNRAWIDELNSNWWCAL